MSTMNERAQATSGYLTFAKGKKMLRAFLYPRENNLYSIFLTFSQLGTTKLGSFPQKLIDKSNIFLDDYISET
jgi:hypothetical protein